MRNLLLGIWFIFFGFPSERQDLLDSKLPVVVFVKRFSQQSELTYLLNEKLLEKKIVVVSREKANQMVRSEIEETSIIGYNKVSRQINPENIVELVNNHIAELPYVAQRLVVAVVLDKDLKFDSCYYFVQGLPQHKNNLIKTFINDSIVKKNDLNLLANTIVELSTKKPMDK